MKTLLIFRRRTSLSSGMRISFPTFRNQIRLIFRKETLLSLRRQILPFSRIRTPPVFRKETLLSLRRQRIPSLRRQKTARMTVPPPLSCTFPIVCGTVSFRGTVDSAAAEAAFREPHPRLLSAALRVPAGCGVKILPGKKNVLCADGVIRDDQDGQKTTPRDRQGVVPIIIIQDLLASLARRMRQRTQEKGSVHGTEERLSKGLKRLLPSRL